MDLITNEIVPPLFWLKCNTAATKLHTASSAIKLRKIRRNSTTLATLTSSCSSDNNSSNIFSIKTTATTSFQWLFLILLIYLFNGYNSGLADAQDIDECRVHPNICGTGICKNDEDSYKCYCPPGYTGIHCDWDVDECLSQPCQNGATCHNKINAYECVCAQGYMGLNCEVVCNVNYGGKDCSVPLTSCMASPCLNGGFCKPYLVNVTEHLFNCTCQDGFQGDTCEKTTTISMVKGSLITVKTQRDEGYDMNLQFRTTLPNGVLAFGTSGELNEPVSYILELINGRLNLHSSLLNKWEGVFIGSKLNDSNWHKVFVAINTSHLVLSANDEQVIYPVHSYETETAGKPSFALTYLGGTIPYLKSFLRHLTHPPSDFVGCMQNILVNGKWIFPKEISSDQDTDLKDVQSGCQRKEQCAPSPCHSNGECTDLWHTFSCSCKPPHFGHTCKYTYNYVL